MGKPIVGFSLDDELLKDIDESEGYLPADCKGASRSELIRTLIVRGLNTLERPARYYDFRDMISDAHIGSNEATGLDCPVCGGHNLHLVKVKEHTDSPSDGRASVKLRFHCEFGHDIEVNFYQYKGTTYARVQRFGDWEEFEKIAE